MKIVCSWWSVVIVKDNLKAYIRTEWFCLYQIRYWFQVSVSHNASLQLVSDEPN